MTRTLPNAPLWPRFGRSGSSAEAIVSSSVTTPAIGASTVATEPPSASRRPNPTGRSATIHLVGKPGRFVVESAEPIHPREEAPLSIVEAVLDVGREQVAPAGAPDAVRDRDRVVGLVA